VGSANHGSTLLLFKEKEVGINEGHIIFICLYLSISPFTRRNHTWNLKMMLSFLIGSQKKKKKASSRMESAAEEAEIAIAEVVMGQLILVDLVIINLFSNLIFPF
jgi:hypothetical protein